MFSTSLHRRRSRPCVRKLLAPIVGFLEFTGLDHGAHRAVDDHNAALEGLDESVGGGTCCGHSVEGFLQNLNLLALFQG